MGALEPWHLIVILVIVLIVFGPGKLPQLGKALGDGIRELKHASDAPDENASAHAAAASGTTAATGPQPVASAVRVCVQCHAPLAAADRFCGACGAAQHAGTTSASAL